MDSTALRELRAARRRKVAGAAVIAVLVAAVVVAVVLTTRGVGTTPPAACAPAPCADDGGNLRVFIDGAAALPGGGGTGTVVQVTVRVVNASQAARAVNALDFSLRDATGAAHALLQVAGAQCGVFEAVQLGPGATLGPKALCFATPASPGAPLTLVWTPGTRPIDIAVSPR